jgi:hypothetical protein
MGAYRLGLERTNSMKLYKSKKRPAIGSEKGAMDGTTVVDNGQRSVGTSVFWKKQK